MSEPSLTDNEIWLSRRYLDRPAVDRIVAARVAEAVDRERAAWATKVETLAGDWDGRYSTGYVSSTRDRPPRPPGCRRHRGQARGGTMTVDEALADVHKHFCLRDGTHDDACLALRQWRTAGQ